MKSLKVQLLVSALAVCCLAAAFVISSSSMDNIDRQPPPSKQPEYPLVTTLSVEKGNYNALVTGYGSANPQQILNLTAELSGRVVELSPNFYSGKRFQAGAVLLKIDDVEYKEAVASAESSLATAEVEMSREILNRKQAQEERKRSGLSSRSDSELLLYKAARAKVKHARKTLEKALSDLSKTQLKAPFNAQIVSRSVELGSYVQRGTEITQLYGTDQLEVSIPLSEKQWANLPAMNKGDTAWKVSLFNTEGSSRWIGYVNRAERHLDSYSRQRTLIIQVEHPLDQQIPLYPGTFVRAEVPGRKVTAIWQVPSSAISPSNQIWYVTEAGELKNAAANVHFSSADSVFITPIQDMQKANIVVQPLSSYLPGMRVIKRDEGKNTKGQNDGVKKQPDISDLGEVQR